MKQWSVTIRLFIVLFIVILLIMSKFVEGYSSTLSLLGLLSIEVDLTAKLEMYTGSLPHELHKSKILETNSFVDESYMENPINNYHLLTRFSTYWLPLISYCEKHYEYCQQQTEFREFVKSLAIYDIRADRIHSARTEAAVSIALLTTMYRLDMNDVIEGKILDFESAPLIDSDLDFIMDQCKLRSLFRELETLLLAYLRRLKKFRKCKENSSTYSKITTELLELVHHHHKEHRTDISLRILEKASELDDPRITKLHEEYKMNKETKEGDAEYQDDGFLNYCGGKVKRDMSNLGCHFGRTSVPYYRSKIEAFNRNPPLLVFHDVISEEEIKLFKSLSLLKMRQSSISDRDDKMVESNSFRVSDTAWVSAEDENSVQLRKISQRISLLTGLDATVDDRRSGAEHYQVVNYGTGGFFYFHHDYFGQPLWQSTNRTMPSEHDNVKRSGDRIATWMFYLNDVRAGGATVFPEIKSKVHPVKGSAVMWYNYKPNGEPDARMLHAGCPVLLGSKWVVNRWIRQGNQVLSLKCDTNGQDFIG